MCGIAGHTGDITDQRLERMLDLLQHRGPDSRGAARLPGIAAIGATRLAIMDTSPRGDQPAHACTGDVQVAMNGEIYNDAELRAELISKGHVFRGAGDTEVVAHAYEEWGDSVWTRFQGMFAIAVLDLNRSALLLARDIAGEKPLYYQVVGGNLHFASESWVLSRITGTRELDTGSLASFAKFGSVRGERTMYEGILSLEPGTVRTWDLIRSDFSGTRTEIPVGRTEDDSISPADLQSGISAAIMKAARADVPGALLLSGGLDSGLLAGVLTKSEVVTEAFTLHFSTSGYDELDDTKATAEHFGVELNVVDTDAGDFEKLVLGYLDDIDQPTVDGLNVYAITQSVAAAGFKLGFSGVGSDELFGGYSTFRYLGLPQVPRAAFRLLDRHVAARPDSRYKKAWIGASAGRRGLAASYDELRSLEPILWNACTSREVSPPWPTTGTFGTDTGRAVADLEMRRYLVDTLLRDSDIASMRNGVELRAPFLHPEILRLAAVVGPSRSKSVLRAAFKDQLPAHLVTPARKKGFAVPLGAWMSSDPGQRTMADLLGDVPLEESGYVQPGTGRQLRDLMRRDLDEPRWYSMYLAIFAYAILNRWYRRNISVAT